VRFFFLLTLLAWVRYAQGVTGDNGKCGNCNNRSCALKSRVRVTRQFLLAGIGVFRAGFHEQADNVTLPFVLLLLDVWRWKSDRLHPFGAASK